MHLVTSDFSHVWINIHLLSHYIRDKRNQIVFFLAFLLTLYSSRIFRSSSSSLSVHTYDSLRCTIVVVVEPFWAACHFHFSLGIWLSLFLEVISLCLACNIILKYSWCVHVGVITCCGWSAEDLICYGKHLCRGRVAPLRFQKWQSHDQRLSALIIPIRSTSSVNLSPTSIKSMSVPDSVSRSSFSPTMAKCPLLKLTQVVAHLSASDRLTSFEDYRSCWTWILSPYFLDMAAG